MTSLRITFLVILIGCFGSVLSASERWETLRAINLVENPTNQTGYGSKGELGPYQFRSSTWRMHTNKPFKLANDRAAADQIAVQHYEWIKERLSSAGIDPNSYNIALAWNCGLAAVVSGHIPMQSYQYAERVSNMAKNFQNTEAANNEMVVVSTKAASPASAVEFKLASGDSIPVVRLVTEPVQFRIPTRESSPFVLATISPGFVLAAN